MKKLINRIKSGISSFVKAIGLRILFSEPQEVAPIANPEPEDCLFSSIHELPFILFEDCLINNRFTSLIKIQTGAVEVFKPTVPEHMLLERWMKLYSEYCENIGDKNLLSAVKLAARIAVFESKIMRVQMIVEQLRTWYDPQQVNHLKIDIWGVSIDSSSYQAYQKSLDMVLSHLKTDIITRDALVIEYTDLQTKSKGGRKITESYFSEKLMEVSKYEGYRVAKGSITTGEYCQYIKRLDKHYEYLNNKTKKGKK